MQGLHCAAFCAILLCSLPTLGSSVFRCEDAKGHVTFTRQGCPDTHSQRLQPQLRLRQPLLPHRLSSRQRIPSWAQRSSQQKLQHLLRSLNTALNCLRWIQPSWLQAAWTMTS